MNIDIEFAAVPKMKSVVAFRLPFAYCGGSCESGADGFTESTDNYKPRYVWYFSRWNKKPRVSVLFGSDGATWLDSTDEEAIKIVLLFLERRGYKDVVIEEKLIVDEDV